MGTLQLKNQPARKEQNRALEALQAGMERCAWPRCHASCHNPTLAGVVTRSASFLDRCIPGVAI